MTDARQIGFRSVERRKPQESRHKQERNRAMMCYVWRQVAGAAALVLLVAASAIATSPETSSSEAPGKKYTLRYKFGPDQTLRWKVVHRARVDASVGGVSQTTESVSNSVKVWKVRKVEPNGSTTFEQMVEHVDMWQKLTGRAEVRYNSQTDKAPPAGFENVAKSIGVPLSRTTIDSQGKVLARRQLAGMSKVQQETMLTIPLPDEPVAMGETWSIPCDIDVPLEGGTVKKIKARQTFTLEAVQGSAATVRLATQILTPVDDPAIEAQLMQRDSTGTVTFDLEAGRVVAQKMDTDKRVVGFRGHASSLHYRTQFTEELMGKEPQPTANKTAATDVKAESKTVDPEVAKTSAASTTTTDVPSPPAADAGKTKSSKDAKASDSSARPKASPLAKPKAES